MLKERCKICDLGFMNADLQNELTKHEIIINEAKSTQN